MSEQDRFDWSDEDDFGSLADEPIEGFADFEDGDDFSSMDEDIAGDDAAEDSPELKQQPTSVKAVRGRGISSGELGFLFSVSTLVAAAGIGSASLLAVGVNPSILWQPAELLQWQNYLSLQNHPLNILALICLGVIALTLLGSRAIAKAAAGANNRTAAAEEMLDRITSLRLENESSWQDPAFKSFEPAGTFVAETLGAWRLQQGRQKRFMGLEGELHRLEKALSDNSREDLAGRFDNPAVGTLADEMKRYHDEREAFAIELKTLRDKDQGTAAEIVQILQDARCWHDASGQNLGLQGAAVDRLASRLGDVVNDLAASGDAEGRVVFAEFKSEFDRIRVAASKVPSGSSELSELVDKANKLAFQIAMEVARLGPRGERLVPMSQAFEDLTTEFRAVADHANAEASPGQQWADSLDQLGGKLARLEAVIAGGGQESMEQIRQCGPAARQLAANLTEIVQSYQPQAERLTNLGTEFAAFSGAEFDPEDLSSGNPENPPAGVLSIEGRTPFADEDQVHNEGGIHQPADVDPFAVKPQPQVVEAPGDPDFTSSVGEPATDIFGSDLDSDKLPKLEIETSFGMREDPFGEAASPAAEPEEEKVYDLADFGAEAATVEDEVFEMEDLGATPLAAEPSVEPAEKIYDLADFGAVALDDAAPPEGEKIYDLNEFGAVQLG